MSAKQRNARLATPVWSWALLPMLLAAALVVPALNRDIFDVDEAATMIPAGARHLGPHSIFEAVDVSVTRWPGVGLGHVISHVVWGRLVGWSEFAVRALPWFIGILSLAWIYRTGRDLFNARVALVATLALSTSVVFLVYMHVARSYGAAILLATVALWGYWQVALAPRPPGIAGRLALVLGATGLLYAHYLCALLLPALGLFHLLFVRRSRRWRQPVILLCLAFLLAMPNLTDLLVRINLLLPLAQQPTSALHAPGAISQIIRYLSNGLLHPQFPVNSLLIVALVVVTAHAVWRYRSRSRPPSATLFLAVTAAFLLLLLLGTNEWLRVLAPGRVRYQAALWPPVLLLIGAVAYLPKSDVIRSAGLALIIFAAVAGTNDFLTDGELIRHSWFWKKHPVSIPITRLIAEKASENSLLLLDTGTFTDRNRSYEFYTGMWESRRARLRPHTDSRALLELAWGHDRVLLLYRKSVVDQANIDEHVNLFSQQGWSLHSSWQDDEVILQQYDSPLWAGIVEQTGLQFDRNVRLTGLVAARQGDQLALRVGLHSSDDLLLARYSLAVHVIDARTGERVVQGDVGVGPGTFVPVYSEMDIGALPGGDYEVQVALYDWQTGERLNARDLQTGNVSDMHVLHQFRVD